MKKMTLSLLLLFVMSSVSHATNSPELPCGLQGSIEMRINNCFYQPYSFNPDFSLVAQSKINNNSRFVRVFQDNKTKMLWSDAVDFENNEDDYVSLKDAESICSEYMKSTFNLEGMWKLPTKDNYEQAMKNNLQTISMPKGIADFWTASKKTSEKYYYFYWNSSPYDTSKPYEYEFLALHPFDEVLMVQCVGNVAE